MKEKKIPVITINREYGAGGRTLAQMLSERLDIPYYDRDFVSKTVQESGYDEEDVEREGEEISRPSNMLNSFLNSAVSYSSSTDAIFKAEKNVILELAESPCIIVGRCADRILADAGIDTVSIYLHAPLEKRLKRAQELAENGDTKLEKFVEGHDSKRSTFYKKFTGKEINDASNYTFCFDAGKISIPACADMIVKWLGSDVAEGGAEE
ncbi:MAG: cytidylate kinase-like family protein [Lachnospiraceae bacterium]|nr:cytidylate kinase-like family protein [Lachnospiraceae bacterium]